MDSGLRVLLAVSLVCVSQCLVDQPTSLPCRECAQRKRLADEVVSKEELRQARIELIKRQILQKLRLSEPPKPSKPVIPSVLNSAGVLSNNIDDFASEDSADDYYGTTENVVLFPDNGSEDGSGRWGVPSASLRFRLDDLPPGRPTAHLWVYRKEQSSPNVTYILYDIQPATNTTETRERILHVDYVSKRTLPSWHKYDVTSSLGSWLRYSRTRTFEIDCHGCDSDPVDTSLVNRPFVVVNADPSHNLKRKKRSFECSTGTSHCCREEFYLSFQEIGWDEWIIQPKGYKANFCRGSCEDDVSLARYHHSTMVQKYIQRKRANTSNLTISLCCSPSKLSPLAMLYVGKDENVYHKRLPNLIVDACDCA